MKRRIKKWIALMLGLVFCFWGCDVRGWALDVNSEGGAEYNLVYTLEESEVVLSGAWGEHKLNYVFYEDGTLEINGSGEMSETVFYYFPDEMISTSPFWEWRDDIIKVVVGDGVTSMTGVLAYCTNLKEVTIGSSVSSMVAAFVGCTSLESVYFRGSAPEFYSDIFSGVTATAYYPVNDASWTSDVMQDYGGTITWVPYTRTDGDTLIVRRGNTYYFQDEIDSNVTYGSIVFGRTTDIYLTGDWDGDGVDTICVRRGNKYYFQSTPLSDAVDECVAFGKSTDEAVVGDWDGDGADELAVKRGNTYYFQEDVSSTEILGSVSFGSISDTAIAGDWNGDGSDSLALKRGNTYYFQTVYSSSKVYETVTFGRSLDTAIAGDWDCDGKDTLGLQRSNVYYFQKTLDSDQLFSSVTYGTSKDIGSAGKWK